MTMVKVTLEGKNGNEYEARVPIVKACMAMYCEVYHKGARISRMGYSVVRKIHDFYISNATEAEEINQANYLMELLTPVMEREERMVGRNGVELYRD